MNFTKHSSKLYSHAFLSPSNYHWIRYSDDKLIDVYRRRNAAAYGTRLHEFAKEAIELRIKLPDKPKTLNMFVNDAIGFDMKPEQLLVYSMNAYGTADAIAFNEVTNTLRIHDLKTGTSLASFDQVLIYASLFFLEYNEFKPKKTTIITRIYQNDEIAEQIITASQVIQIMRKIKHFDKLIDSL